MVSGLVTYWSVLLIWLPSLHAEALPPEVLEERACSGETLQLHCPGPGMVLVVESASYGRKSVSACGGNTALLRPCALATSLALVNVRCFGKQSCEISVTASTFNDPCPGIPKYLEVTYQCIDRSNIINVCENSNVASLGGYLTSPGYPQPYQPSESCRLQFDHPSNMAANIRVLDLEVEARNEANGCFDWLILREEEVIAKKHDYCGNMLTMSAPKDVTFENLNLYFKTDGVNQYRGFLLKFTAKPSTSIGAQSKQDHGVAVPPLPAGVALDQEQRKLLETAKALQRHMPGGGVQRRHNLIFDNAANRDMLAYLRESQDEKQVDMLAMLSSDRSEKTAGDTWDIKPRDRPAGRHTGDGCTERMAREHLPMNAKLHGFKEGKIFHIRCVAGYQLTDEDEAVYVCSGNFWVGAGTAQCQKFSCSEPLSPLHGAVEATDSHYGSQAYYSCDRGYRLQGDAVRTCLTTGSWSGHEPTCKALSRSSQATFSIPIEIPFAVALTLLYWTCKKRLAKIPGGIRSKVV